MKYADVIVDIAQGSLDRIFQYRIPDGMGEELTEGTPVYVPFGRGNRLVKGYITGFSDQTSYQPEGLKEIHSVIRGEMSIEQRLLSLAVWMKQRYGCTMIQAMKTVTPVKKKVKPRVERVLMRTVSTGEILDYLHTHVKKNQTARIRLLQALASDEQIPYEAVLHKLNISKSALDSVIQAGLARLEEKRNMNEPEGGPVVPHVVLNEEQEKAVSQFVRDFDRGQPGVTLLHGITGSGKTEVYMEMIAHILSRGRQVIMLIPEISLTYQTVMRFYRRFGSRVAFIHSRLSQGERYDQFERARNGQVSIMIGPRSALFTPFPRLGLIVIDEEHEGAYKNETVPRYHAVDVAKRLAEMTGAGLVLGSATPSVDTYARAVRGDYKLDRLTRRAQEGSRLAAVSVVDLREELKAGNRSIFSRRLFAGITQRLEQKEQVMLFLNRRGYSSFVSCRSCGEAIKCPHCDVSLKAHRNGMLVCHYCGYTAPIPRLCPSCGSPYIAGFGTGTQKVEEAAVKMFPKARILRMDQDTTGGKDGHEKILSAFMAHEADILIGTQMIVKGHDFPDVTLVAALAADLSLYADDFRGAERTFQLLTQAAGRSGRRGRPGEMLIQTYVPEHYSIRAAAEQDYEMFFREEMSYRRLMDYPPCTEMVSVTVSSRREELAKEGAALIAGKLGDFCQTGLTVIGPADPGITKINDIFYQIVYFKSGDSRLILQAVNEIESYYEWTDLKKNVMIQFDFK